MGNDLRGQGFGERARSIFTLRVDDDACVAPAEVFAVTPDNGEHLLVWYNPDRIFSPDAFAAEGGGLQYGGRVAGLD